MILAYVFIQYRKDCKKYGKENLAVSLEERLATYLLWVVLPLVVGIMRGL